MFAVLYLLLLVVWVLVLDSKIRLGPVGVEAPIPADGQRWLDAAARRANASAGDSMTEARAKDAKADSPKEE
jgi:hypothetical protein